MTAADSFFIHQFLPLTHYRGAAAEVKSLLADGCCPVLDLEDSVQCLFDAERNLRLKAVARQGLLHLAGVLAAAGVPPGKVLVRINHRGTPHHEADIAALAGCCAAGFVAGVLLPKVESPEDVQQFQESMRRAAGVAPVVTPLIESRAGVDHAGEILAVCQGDDARAVFGYFDYALESGHWPLLSPFSREYWELSLGLREAVESAGARYIHSPFPLLDDGDGLLCIKSMLLAHGVKAPGMCSLGQGQTAVLHRPAAAAAVTFAEAPLNDAAARAEWIIAGFQHTHSNKRSFAVADGYFITPHEYLLACRFIEGRAP